MSSFYRFSVIAALTILCQAGFVLPVYAKSEVRHIKIKTISKLLSIKYPSSSVKYVVSGYRNDNDGGGGIFKFSSLSKEKVDNGTVFKPAYGKGRFLRQFNKKDKYRAEWFGAYGDGKHNDTPAITACLNSLDRVNLMAKTYSVAPTFWKSEPTLSLGSIVVGPNDKIIGDDREKSLLRLPDNSNPNSKAKNIYFSVIVSPSFTRAVDNVVVKNLSIDCNFDKQDKHSTIGAVYVRGGNLLVEKLNIRGFGTGYNPNSKNTHECFVVCQQLAYKSYHTSQQGPVIRDIVFSDPGSNAKAVGKNHVAEITLVLVGGHNNYANRSYIMPKGYDKEFDKTDGGDNDNNWWPTYGGVVEGVRAENMRIDPKIQKSPYNGITYADSVGMVVKNNYFKNYDGTCVYVMSWHNRDCVIRDNKFINVNLGVGLQAHGKNGKPITPPKHVNTIVERNEIKVGTAQYYEWTPTGIQLYCQKVGPLKRYENIKIRNNKISACPAYKNKKGKMVYSVGINLDFPELNFEKIIVKNNTIDVKDAPKGTQKYSNSILYKCRPESVKDLTNGNVVIKNNRTRSGRLLKATIQKK